MSKDTLTESVIEAQRDAVAIATHAARGDAAAVAMVWNDNGNREQLIWRLARLPWVLTTGLAGCYGKALDFEGQCEAILRGLPRTVEDVDQLIDGDRPFADEDNQED